MRAIVITLTSIFLICLLFSPGSRATNTAVNADAAVEADPLVLAINEYKLRMKASRYQEALSLAEQIVRLIEEQAQPDPFELAFAIESRAALEQQVKLYRRAEESYQTSIGIVEKHGGIYSTRLVSKLSRLGGLYYQTGQYDESMEILRRAQHIIHRQKGVYSLDQLNIVDWITQINLRTNKAREADIQQHYYYMINASNYGENDPRIIPALTKLADWYRRSGQYPSALDAYRRTLDLMEELKPEADLERLEPLRAISTTLYLQGSCCADEPLSRALEVVTNSSSADLSDQLDALMHLADMRLLQRRHDEARELYQRAWKMVAPENNMSQRGMDLFGSPTRLGVAKTDDVVTAFRLASEGYSQPEYVGSQRIRLGDQVEKQGSSWSEDSGRSPAGKLIGDPLPLCYSEVLALARTRDVNRLATYYMDLDFTVNQNGKVIAVEVLESNTPFKLGRFVKNMLYNTRFRPRYEDGEPVLTEHVELRQTFTFEPGQYRHRDSPMPDSASAIFEGCQLLASR
jgi:tetratricopeptide (TPR) repeat protein